MTQPTNIIKALAYTLILLICGALSHSCSDDDKIQGGAPTVLFQVDVLNIDLNKANRPIIVSVVNSDVGLKSINMYVLKEGGVEQPFQEPISSFTKLNRNSYSINLTPTYMEDMTGFRIVAVDQNNQTTTNELPFAIVPLRDPPVVIFNEGIHSINYLEGQPTPDLYFKVTSEDRLTSIVLSEVVNKIERTLYTKIFVDSENENSFSYNLLTELGFMFTPNTTSLKVTVVAGPAENQKRKVATLLVNYRELLAPVVTFDNGEGPITIDEHRPLTIKGKIVAESNIESVRFYKQTGEDTFVAYAGTELNFIPSIPNYSFTLDAGNMSPEILGVMVEVADDLGKTSKTIQKIVVNELIPKPTIVLGLANENLNGVGKDTQIRMTGTVTTLGELASVKIITIAADGTEDVKFSETITPANNKTFAIDRNLLAESTLRGIRIEATDIVGKLSVSETLTVHVGYRYSEVLVSGSGLTPFVGTTPFFSASKVRAYSICDAKDNVGEVDVAFATFGSNTQMTALALNNSNLSGGKFNHATCTPKQWEGVIVKPIKSTTGVKRNNFDISTIDEIQAEAVTTIIPNNGAQLYMTGGTAGPNGFDSPADWAVIYQIKVNGVNKRVIFCYDRREGSTFPLDATKFWIKVKIEM